MAAHLHTHSLFHSTPELSTLWGRLIVGAARQPASQPSRPADARRKLFSPLDREGSWRARRRYSGCWWRRLWRRSVGASAPAPLCPNCRLPISSSPARLCATQISTLPLDRFSPVLHPHSCRSQVFLVQLSQRKRPQDARQSSSRNSGYANRQQIVW